MLSGTIFSSLHRAQLVVQMHGETTARDSVRRRYPVERSVVLKQHECFPLHNSTSKLIAMFLSMSYLSSRLRNSRILQLSE